MDIIVLDTSFKRIGILDVFFSLVWNERYYSAGDFEIQTEPTASNLSLLQINNYLQLPGSEKTMIIESIHIHQNQEKKNVLTISGRSLESILDRRIVLQQTIMNGDFKSFQLGVELLLNQNIIASSQPRRIISNFTFIPPEPSELYLASLKWESQYYGENIYDILVEECQKRNVGFKITLDENNNFVFRLYVGLDRSYDQSERPYVVFSSDFDNLLSSSYFVSTKYYKNYVLSFGQFRADYPYGLETGSTDAIVGLDRREMGHDASDISAYEEGTATLIPLAEYHSQLRERNRVVLSQNKPIQYFDAEVDPNSGYKYGVDYYLGDILQVKDDFGHSEKVRVLEVTISEDLSGITIHPTFQKL